MTQQTETDQKSSTKMKKLDNNRNKNVTMGILTLFVLASVSFMAVIIFLVTDDLVTRLMTAPAVIFVAVKLIERFIK